MIYVDDARMLQTMVPGCLSVLRTPREFFRQLPASPFYRNSIMVMTFVTMISVIVTVPFYTEAMLFLYPVVWVVALITLKLCEVYLVWAVRCFADQPLAGSNAFRVITYASVPMALIFVPWLALVALLWSLYLMWLGLVERLKVAPGTAASIVLVPSLLLMVAVGVGLVLLMSVMPQLAGLL
ncbi:MAG: YIP1 family protein [Mariprofundales bacterium]